MSRSGSLRLALSTLQTFLSSRLQRATSILADPVPKNSNECNDQIDGLFEIHQLIEVSIKNIEQKDSDWQKVINDLDSDGIKVEQQLYEQVATGPTCGYFCVLNEAQSMLARISTQMRKLNRSLVDMSNILLTNSATGDLGSLTSHSQSSRVKIPKLIFPMFEGDILKWKEFWNIFRCTIHDRVDFSPVEKFSYLLPQLQGPAKQAIEGLMITDENYDTAIDILKKRFDRSNDRIVSILYAQLKQLRRCGSGCDEKRRTFDTCERIFRQLILADEDVDSSRALTIDFLSKFPSAMVRDLYRHYKVDGYSKLSEVRSAIDKSISELETTSALLDDLDAITGAMPKARDLTSNENRHDKMSSNAGSEISPEYSYSEVAQPTNLTFSAIATSTNRSIPRPSPKSSCYFCNGFHFNGDCTEYPTAQRREQRLLELKRCIKCGRNHNPGGKRNECNNSSVKCVHCNTKHDHYSALCSNRYPVERDFQY